MSRHALVVVVALAGCRGEASRDDRREAVAEALLGRPLASERAAEPTAPHVPFENPFPEETPESYAFEAAREGYTDRAEIIERVEGTSETELPPRRLAAAVDAALARYRAIEQTWTERTDCDRLDAAFSALERAGIVARQKFSDCGNCGTGEMMTLVRELRAGGRAVRGWTFFHDQDVEHAAEGDGLSLMHGAAAAGEPVAVAEEIVRALRAEGLDASWSGYVGDRIAVAMDWRKRMFTTAPAGRR
ncbi:MAG TPA: hypothetical protein VMZ28_10770 [Kofleriaceae bacterium]|nr:hypothetical protein [Kofleriaceae bacterium]